VLYVEYNIVLYELYNTLQFLQPPRGEIHGRPCNRHLFDDWLRKTYEITEIPRERWTMAPQRIVSW
jgi:hypothetical protein